jgi:hypothetical protein
MIGILSRFLGGGEWDLNVVEPPWSTRPSIYEHIKSHIVAGETGLSDGGDDLPDDAEVFDEGGLRWVSGGMDGAFGHHGGGDYGQDAAKEVFGLVTSVLKNCTRESVRKLYEAFKEGSAIDLVDPLLELTIGEEDIDANRLHDLAIWLASKAPDREPVKVALAFLGVLQGSDDRETILTLARHEEFTLYASVAITNREENPDRTLWEIAKNVDGWGRIQAVERLAGTTDPEIKDWLLREGYKNAVMYEYLAYTCATAGDLHGALSAGQIDEALLLGAGDIIQTLIMGQGGPAEGIDDFAHGAAVTQDYLRHLDGRAESLEQFLVLKTIERFLSDDEEDWSERSERGWTSEARQSMLATVRKFVGDDKWRGMALTGLRSDDERTFNTAAEVAKELGIDTWDEYYTRTEGGRDYWYYLMQTEDRSRIEKIVELAEARIPLPEIATGPGDELGLGPEFKHHGALDFVLQDLGKFPGLGWTLIKAGLRSPVVRNRNMGIRALAGWDRERWPEGASEYVESCLDAEPNDEVRKGFMKLLAGEPLGF